MKILAERSLKMIARWRKCDLMDDNTGQGLVSTGYRKMSQLWWGICGKALG
jgi:hypothetical protein